MNSKKIITNLSAESALLLLRRNCSSVIGQTRYPSYANGYAAIEACASACAMRA